MRLFMLFYQEKMNMDMTPELLLKRIQKDRKKEILEQGELERDWDKFVHWLQHDYRKFDYQRNKTDKTLSPTSIHQYASAIKKFFKFFSYPLSDVARLPISITQSNGLIHNRRVEYRAEEVKQLLSAVNNFRDRAITLWMFQSGMDISSTLRVTYGQIKEQLERGDSPIIFVATRKKTGKNFRTCVGSDAIDALKIYLKDRTGKRYQCERCGVMWRQKRTTCPRMRCKGKLQETRGKLAHDSMLFTRKNSDQPIKEDAFEKNLKEYVLMSGVVSEEKMKLADKNPGGSHALRMGFSSVLQFYKVNQQIIDGMMGHSVAYNGTYSRLPDSELKAIYAECEEHLSIYQVQEISEVKKELTEQIDQQKIIIKGLQAQIKEMEEQRKARARSIAGNGAGMDIQTMVQIIEAIEAKPRLLEELKSELKRLND